MCIFYIDLRRWGSPRQSWGWQQMQRSTPTPTSGSKSAPCPRPCLVCLGMWWWAAGVISLVGRILQWGWICDRDERLDLCQWHCLVFLGICWWALEWYLWKDGDNSDHHQVVDSPSSFPLLAACLQLQSTSGVTFTISIIINITIIIITIFTIYVIKIMVAFIISLVLVPSLPVSLLCLASLLRWGLHLSWLGGGGG